MKNLDPGIYYWTVQTIDNSFAGSAFANTESFEILPVLPPGDVLARIVGLNEIELTWIDNSNDETGFEIWRSSGTNGNYTHIRTTERDETSYSDLDVSNSTTYYYKLKAITGNLESEYSIEVSITTYPADVTVACGTISEYTIWSGTVKVICDVTLDNGYELQIQQGTVIEFEDDYILKINGLLTAVGTSDNQITFTSGKSVKTPGGILSFNHS